MLFATDERRIMNIYLAVFSVELGLEGIEPLRRDGCEEAWV